MHFRDTKKKEKIKRNRKVKKKRALGIKSLGFIYPEIKLKEKK